jgi:hypothetical protein
LFSVMQKLRDLPLFLHQREQKRRFAVVRNGVAAVSAAAGCSSGQQAGQASCLMVECPTAAADVLAIASGTQRFSGCNTRRQRPTASRSSSRSTRSSSGGFSPATLNADGLQELLQRMVAAVREAPPVPLPSDADSE